MAAIGPLVEKNARGFGRFPASFASRFGRGPSDSGVGNLQRFLLALDLVTSWSVPAEKLGEDLDPHSAAYLRALQVRETERRSTIADLERLGFEVVRVPGISEGDRGIGCLNGLHDKTRYFMPAWGGLFEPLDRAARAAFESALGPTVKVVPILCSETQRRSGGVHCAVSAWPRP